jgi:hypothetical protein
MTPVLASLLQAVDGYMAVMTRLLSNPKEIAERGEKIYDEKYKSRFEQEHPRKFVAIDVTTEEAYLGDTPEGVLESAHGASPNGIFHLIQVGFPSAIRISYTNHAVVDGIFR